MPTSPPIARRAWSMRGGVAMPVVSASVIAAAPPSRSRMTRSTTCSMAMSPSYGEPKVHDTTASTGTPPATRQMAPIWATDSAISILTLRRLYSADAEIVTVNSSTPAASRHLGAAQVGNERGAHHPVGPSHGGDDFGRARHRRNGRWADERGHLEVSHPGGEQRVDQCDPIGDRDGRLALQPVASGHIADLHDRSVASARPRRRRSRSRRASPAPSRATSASTRLGRHAPCTASS